MDWLRCLQLVRWRNPTSQPEAAALLLMLKENFPILNAFWIIIFLRHFSFNRCPLLNRPKDLVWTCFFIILISSEFWSGIWKIQWAKNIKYCKIVWLSFWYQLKSDFLIFVAKWTYFWKWNTSIPLFKKYIKLAKKLLFTTFTHFIVI